ncbi:EAL domain-containing protein [Egicoccus sp. AB-alg6-2]|uniref:EAL domain-containing protein n=1 Tax=Egicoccus sp. AB-alg6-2 TaxID=3242692 RepID=UPI00359DB14D
MRSETTMDRREAPVPRELRSAVPFATRDWRRDHGTHADPEALLLADAIDEGRLQVVYQPVVDLSCGRAVAVEALVRLSGPLDPPLAAASGIVRVAERSGLIQALGTDVLVRACAQLAAWRRQPELAALRLHVNVSPLQLGSRAFVELVRRTLAATALPAGCLVVEVTETAAFDHLSDGSQLHALADLGVGIALDDFGTGFATLDLLASAPFTMLKLDRSFVAAVGTTSGPARGRALVVQAAIGLGTSLGLDVVAEGIEHREQVVLLREWGCELGQGHLYAPASGDAELRDYVAGHQESAVEPAASLIGAQALDLAAIIAVAVVAGDPRPGSLRADAVEAARIVGFALSLTRARVDVIGLLAALVGTGDLLQVLRTMHAVPAWRELEEALSQAPRLAVDVHPGAVAAAVARLAVARRVGRPLEDALDDVLDDVALRGHLLERLDAWWHEPATSPPPLPVVREFEQRVRGRDDAAERLRGLVGVARAIGSDGELADVLEIAADAALGAMGAASLSISRWDREAAELRTVVNVGWLGPDEERRPTAEHYSLKELPASSRLVLERRVLLTAVDDPTTEPGERDILRRLRKGSAAGVPIVVEGTVWGELYATTAESSPPFTSADIPYVSAVAGFIGFAIARAEHLGNLSRLAGEDPLTRLANRRRLEDFAASQLARSDTGHVTAVMLDVNGLKEINDVYGHAAGDELLITVADALNRVAVTQSEALAARLGGDEFCVVLAGDADDALRMVERFFELLRAAPTRQPQVSVGVAAARSDDHSFTDLLARADAAQYRAKASGVAVVFDDGADDRPIPSRLLHDDPTPDQRVRSERPGRSVDASLGRWSRALAERGPAVPGLQLVGEVALNLFDLNRWTLSVAQPDSSVLTIHDTHLRRRRPRAPLAPPEPDEQYTIDDFPITAAAFVDGQGFAVSSDDPAADPQEVAVLEADGFRYVVGLTETMPDGTRWLLECYGDEDSRPMQEVVPLVEALASRTLQRRVRCAS